MYFHMQLVKFRSGSSPCVIEANDGSWLTEGVKLAVKHYEACAPAGAFFKEDMTGILDLT